MLGSNALRHAAELQGHAQSPAHRFSDEGESGAARTGVAQKWEETGVYRQIQKSREDAELFVLHDGPPFANGDVHMGTALNKILKDFVVKSQTMLGKRAPYVPGWDCHGLPIEYKVVKESRDLAPLEVRKRCEAFARKFIDLQRQAIQTPRRFRRLGQSLSHHGSHLRSGNSARLRCLRRERSGLRIE